MSLPTGVGVGMASVTFDGVCTTLVRNVRED
jgi:hypothetical protein